MEAIFTDRRQAGQRLGQAVAARVIRAEAEGEIGKAVTRERGEFLVLGIPRGGMVVAAEVARAVSGRLDVVLARKLRAPYQPELAIGAVVSGERRFVDEEMAGMAGATPEYLEREIAFQEEEIARRLHAFRGERPPPEIRDHPVIIIDDGIATGYTFRAALEGVRSQQPRRLIAAVPVAPVVSLTALGELADEVVCLATPEPFVAVGIWYEDFTQTTDEEVVALLRENWGERA
jgi:putative phosphoribosyl transferase